MGDFGNAALWVGTMLRLVLALSLLVGTAAASGPMSYYDYDPLCRELLDGSIGQVSDDNLLRPLDEVRFTMVDALNRPTQFHIERSANHLILPSLDSLFARPEEEALRCLASALHVPFRYVDDVDDANLSFVVLWAGMDALNVGWPSGYTEYYGSEAPAGEWVTHGGTLSANERDPFHVDLERAEPVDYDDLAIALRGPANQPQITCDARTLSGDDGTFFARLVVPVTEFEPIRSWGGPLPVPPDPQAQLFRDTFACLVLGLLDRFDPADLALATGQSIVSIENWGLRHWPPDLFTDGQGTTDYAAFCDSIRGARLDLTHDVLDRANLLIPLERLDWVVLDLSDRLSRQSTVPPEKLEPIRQAIDCVLSSVGIAYGIDDIARDDRNATIIFGYNMGGGDVDVTTAYTYRTPGLSNGALPRRVLANEPAALTAESARYHYLDQSWLWAVNTPRRADACEARLYSTSSGDALLDIEIDEDRSEGHPEVVFGRTAACLISALFATYDPLLVARAARYGMPLVRGAFAFEPSRRGLEPDEVIRPPW